MNNRLLELALLEMERLKEAAPTRDAYAYALKVRERIQTQLELPHDKRESSLTALLTS